MHSTINRDIRNAIERQLARHYRAKKLTSKRMYDIKLKLSEGEIGWEIKSQIFLEGQELSIIVVCGDNFPYKKPDVYVRPELDALSYPHVEPNGRLCIWDEQVQFNPSKVWYVNELVNDAHALLTSIVEGELDEDFVNGFLSYWSVAWRMAENTYSICNLQNNLSRKVKVAYVGKKQIYFADSERELHEWLTNKKISTKRLKIYDSFLVSIDKPWMPNEYPRTMFDLFKILRHQGLSDPEVAELFRGLFSAKAATPMILCRVNTPNGVCAVSLCTTDNLNNRNRDGLGRGYRHGNISKKVALRRGIKLKVFGGLTYRMDPSWICGRDQNDDLQHMSGTKVAVIGLGSVGSSLLSHLARAGVSNFILSDNDSLAPENICRHELGAKYIGIKKAEAMKRHLSENYPHVCVHKVCTGGWEKDAEFLDALSDADLIIAATANWSSDKQLNNIVREHGWECPVLFCFTEAHASAIHCVFNPADSDYFTELHNTNGSLNLPVTQWKELTTKKLPSCGGHYQPYGGIELSFGHSLICDTAVKFITGEIDGSNPIHKVWIGGNTILVREGGNWNPEWIAIHGDPEQGGCIVDATREQ